MKKISIPDRIFLLVMVLLAAYQISLGITGLKPLATWSYTTGFGTLLVAGLLLIILGFEGLESKIVVIVSTLIPLSISLGLIAEYFPQYVFPYLVFSLVGFAAIAITRYTYAGKSATIVLAVTHGIAGVIITFLPVSLVIQGLASMRFILVGLGGALIGIGGLLLAFLKTGKPLLSQKTILTVLPGLLMLMMAAFLAGFSYN
jgi:hypothetical protein